MEVAAAVAIAVKFKRRSVSAVRDWPKGWSPVSLPIVPKSEPPPAVSNGVIDVADASDSSEPCIRFPPPAAIKLLESSEKMEARKRELIETQPEPKNSVTPQPEEMASVVFSEEMVKLDPPESSKGILDQNQPSEVLIIAKAAVKQCYSRVFPPPKRRKISAVRNFPAGWERNGSIISGNECSPVVTASSLKRKKSDGEKEPVVNQQPTTDSEGFAGVTPAKIAEIKVEREGAEQISEGLQEISAINKLETVAPPSKSKGFDGEKKLLVKQTQETVAAIDEVQVEVRGNDAKPIREKAQEISEVRVMLASKSSLSEITMEENSEKKISVKSTSEKKLEGSEIREKAQEIGSEVRVKSAPRSSSSKITMEENSGKKITVKSVSEKKIGGTEIREKAQELNAEVRVKSAPRGSLSKITMVGNNEKKISVKPISEKKVEGREIKKMSRNLSEVQESEPSLDARKHSVSKFNEKEGTVLARKPVDRRIVKHEMDVKSLERKFLKERENEGRSANDIIGGDHALEAQCDQLIVQALMAAPKCPWRQGKKADGSISRSVTPKIKKKQRKSLEASTSRLKDEAASEDEEDYAPLDEENGKALTIYRPSESSVTLTPLVPPRPVQKGGENDEITIRSRVKRALRLFQVLCRKLLQGEEAKSKEGGRMMRVDLKASTILKENNEWVNYGKPIMGHVPGVEVGDEFHYRTELSIVGLHRPFQAGIDSMKRNGEVLANSIVASGGYPDDTDSTDVLIYSGSGDKQAGDQKLERGNLALKNSIDAQTPVRVIYGFKETRGSEHDSKGKIVSTFTYDGLYVVESYWTETGPHGYSVFKFQLRRMAGQPELALKEVKRSKKAKVREGLCIKDIAEGKESMPICAVNTADDDLPMPFKYTTKNIYPSWYIQTAPRGCDCTDGCLDSEKCACAVKNGGQLPFNYNGAIVQAKPLVYECGPSCKCPPSCHNRVSQYGIKVPLEIFKTESRGWGVRSLYSIQSGTFICEYTGELIKDSDAEQTSNDEYLFDIGHNYEDKSLWEGLPSFIPGLQSNSACDTVDDVGFTIDAAEYGNVGRFINHSCSPNLYAQNVLYDHDDKRMPHIMFFAADNIPPLQELTYHYNYILDQVRDSEGNIKQKKCYCGSPECTGRLY